MSGGFVISEDTLHRMLVEGVIELGPPLSEDTIEWMRRNRTGDDPSYAIENAPVVEKCRTYTRIGLNAHDRRREILLQREVREDDYAEVEELNELIRTAAERMFRLLRPVLEYHRYWTEAELEVSNRTGLEELEGFFDGPIDIHPMDAVEAIKRMHEVAADLGIEYEVPDDDAASPEQIDRWREQLERVESEK